jgi:adenylate cyclase
MRFRLSFTATPRRLALLASALATVLVTAAFSWLLIAGHTPALLQRVDLFIHDNWVKTTLQFDASPQVALLAIDEASLEAIGQWPWPRDLIAEIVRRVVDVHRAKVLALDIVFAEADRSDAAAIGERLAKVPPSGDQALRRELEDLMRSLDRDTVLAQALEGRPVVLGYYFSGDARRRHGALPEPWLPAEMAHAMGVRPQVGPGYGANLEPLVAAARRSGHLNPAVDADGVVRKLPLLIENDGMLYPSLAMSVLTMIAGDQAAIDFGQGSTLGGEEVTESITIGRFRVPIDAAGRSEIPFFGPAGSVPTIPVVDLLQDRVPPGRLEGKVVVFGPTAPGLKDSRATPIAPAQAGSELHVSWLQGALSGQLPSRAYYTDAAVLTAMWCVGLGLLVGARSLRPLTFTLVSVALAAAVWGAGWMLWSRDRVVLPVVLPLAQIALLFVLLGALTYLLERRGRSQLNRLFGQYVPPELVDEMNEDPAQYSMSGRSAELTVMFADVRGFTTLSEKMEPTALGELMNTLLTDLSRVIRADHLGTIDKYIGDCVMAFWGAPVARPDHATEAVSAALDMLASLARLTPTLSLPDGAQIAIGIGMNTGRAVVGNMGSAYRMAYTVLGDTVNTASRLEGLTKTYGVGIVAGDSVRAAAPAAFVWRRLDLVRVKGRETPLGIHEPLCHADEATALLHKLAARHEAALAAYLARRFDEALAAWQALQREHPCALHALWVERAQAFVERPPGPGWDGVYTFESK